MRQGRVGRQLQVGAVLVAGVLVAAYAAWVVRDVGSAAPDVPTKPRPSAQVAPPKPTAPPSLASFRKAATKTRNLLVIGDSTGAGAGSWVDLVAQDLARKRQVSLRQWDPAAGDFAAPVVRGTGKPLQVQNLSYPGIGADYQQRFDQVDGKPGAVILSIGHDRTARSLTKTVRVTGAAIERRWGAVPVAWVLQNPSTGEAAKQQEAAIGRLEELATTERVPVIDVHTAFRKSGRLPQLLADDSRPNPEGSRLWADAVDRALGVDAV